MINEDTKNGSERKYLSTIVKILLTLAVVYFAGRQLVNNWAEVVGYDWKLDYLKLSISFILHVITLILFTRSWSYIIIAMGFKINLRQAFIINYLANLGRYIPGKLWQVFGMIYLLRKIDIGKKTAFASWALSWIYGLPPAFLLCGITAYFNRSFLSEIMGGALNNNFYIMGFIICVLGLSILFVFIPDYSIGILNLMLRKFKRSEINTKFRKSYTIRVYLIYFIAWVVYGTAFYFLIQGLLGDIDLPVLAGIGSFVMAYILGLMAFFSPGGLGVRELILGSLLLPYIGPVSAGIVVAARVWSLLIEMSAAGISVVMHLQKRGELN